MTASGASCVAAAAATVVAVPVPAGTRYTEPVLHWHHCPAVTVSGHLGCLGALASRRQAACAWPGPCPGPGLGSASATPGPLAMQCQSKWVSSSEAIGLGLSQWPGPFFHWQVGHCASSFKLPCRRRRARAACDSDQPAVPSWSRCWLGHRSDPVQGTQPDLASELLTQTQRPASMSLLL